MKKVLNIFLILVIFLFCSGLWHTVHDGLPSNSAENQHLETIARPVYPVQDELWRNRVVATGEIEPLDDVISVAPAIPGVVSEIIVKVGQHVTKGQPLFLIDDSIQRDDHEIRTSEQILVANEAEKAAIRAKEAQRRLNLFLRLRNGGYTEEDIRRLKYDSHLASVEMKIAMNKLEKAQNEVKRSETALEQCVVRSPIDGIVLKVDLKSGEYFSPETANRGLLQVGDISKLIVRAHVDIDDIYDVDTSKPANIVLRDGSRTQIKIRYLRSEMLAKPKVNISGRPGELVDTKIVDLIYSIPGTSQQLFIGQEVDVQLVTRR